MESRKIVLRETAIVTLGELILCAVMVGIFALVGKMDRSVVLGAVFGWLLTSGNFFFLAVAAAIAADKAQEQNVHGGKNVMRSSMALRVLLLFGIMFVLAKSGVCNVFALVLPLVFLRPVLMLGEFFRKKG